MNALKGFVVVSLVVGSTAFAQSSSSSAAAKAPKATEVSTRASVETAAKKADLKVTAPVKDMTTAQKAKAAGF